MTERHREPESDHSLNRARGATHLTGFAPVRLWALALMFSLPWPTSERFIIWFVIGIVVYFSYGVRKRRLARQS